MECAQCGNVLDQRANFCPTCGSAAATTMSHPQPEGSDGTTASIDVAELDPSHELADLPTLQPGTGMLVVVRGPNAGSRYLLDRDITVAGRHPDAEIFLDDVTVSRRHAQFARVEQGRIELSDLGSLNGSYVNGERVDARQLATGDEVQIGRFKLLFVGSPTGAMG